MTRRSRPSTSSGRVWLSLLGMVAASCGAPLMKLPSGPGAPAPDADQVLADATKSCRGIRTFSAEVGVTGNVNGERLRARLLVGAAAPASARIEAVAPFGAPGFIFTAVENDGTLLLPRDNRFLEHEHPDQVLAALAGVPLTAEELRITLTGCWPANAGGRLTERHGTDWRTLDVEPDHVLYVHRDGASAPWRLVAVLRNIEHSGRRWLAEYRDFQNDLPRSVHIVSADQKSHGTYDLTLVVSQVETNIPLDAGVFRVQIPDSASPITLDELRHARTGIRED